MICKLGVDKPMRLISIDFFLHIAIHEGSVDIHLFDGEIHVGRICKEYTNGFQASNRSINFCVVETLYFSESMNDQLCLIPHNYPRIIFLAPENPACVKRPFALRQLNQLPNPQSLELV